MWTVHVPSELHGERLDKALTQLTELSRHHILQCIHSGNVTCVDEVILKPSRKVFEGQVYSICMPKVQTRELKENALPLKVIYEDDFLIVADKPAGQLSHATAGFEGNTLIDSAYGYIARNNIPLKTFIKQPILINRLDKDTSGLIMIAKDDYTHNHIKQQFSNRQVRKIYTAHVHNFDMCPEYMFIESWVGPHKHKVGLMQSFDHTVHHVLPERYADLQHLITCKHREDDLEIINKKRCMIATQEIANFQHFPIMFPKTKYKYAFLECYKHEKYLLCYPHTGRQHQIRVQLATSNHSIINDVLYSGSDNTNLKLRSIFVNFYHPKLNQQITIYNP